MEEERSSGDEAECEPKDSPPRRQALRPPGGLPAVSSVADQLIGKAWVAGPEMKFDRFVAGSPGLRSVMDAMTPSASEAAVGISKLIGGGHLAQVGADAGFKLTDLWANRAGRVWDELHAGPKLTDLWAKATRPVWEGLHAGPGLGAELAGEASARAKEFMTDLGLGRAELRAGGPLGRSVTPVWAGLKSPASELAASFLPAGPQPSVLSGFTSGIAEKMLAGANVGSFAGLDLGLPSRFVADQLSNVGGPAFSGEQWLRSKWSGASVFDGLTAAMHRHAQGLSSWMQTTHQAAMDALWRAPQESIATMLQSFSVLADQGVAWGWQGLWTALRARRAVLRGDVAAVVRFLREVLGFKRTPATLVDAASAVLLEEAAWLPADLEVDEDVCPRIRRLTIREHRNFRLIGETELCGRSVDSLDRKVKVSEDEPGGVPLVELVPAPPPPPSEDDISDPRLVWVMDRLTAREQQIVRMKAEEGRTWPDAAVSCGATIKDGHNVGRKVRRLVKAADAAATVVTGRAAS